MIIGELDMETSKSPDKNPIFVISFCVLALIAIAGYVLFINKYKDKIPADASLYLSAQNYKQAVNEDWSHIKKLSISGDFKDYQILTFLSKCDAKQLRDLQISFEQEISKKSLSVLLERIINFTNLERLDLAGCKALKELPKGIVNLKKLKYLNLSHCNLRSLPKEIDQLSNLDRLYVNHNTELNSLPDEITDLKNLVRFDACECNLDTLPKSIDKLKNLEYLGVSHNNLKVLPEELCELESLWQLEASGCGLDSLPQNMITLKKLTFLNISGNNFSKLPPVLCKMQQLISLSIGRCGLKDLPAEMKNLRNLKYLGLAGNQLTELSEEIFEKIIENLEHLSIEDNKFTSDPKVLKKFRGSRLNK